MPMRRAIFTLSHVSNHQPIARLHHVQIWEQSNRISFAYDRISICHCNKLSAMCRAVQLYQMVFYDVQIAVAEREAAEMQLLLNIACCECRSKTNISPPAHCDLFIWLHFRQTQKSITLSCGMRSPRNSSLLAAAAHVTGRSFIRWVWVMAKVFDSERCSRCFSILLFIDESQQHFVNADAEDILNALLTVHND